MLIIDFLASQTHTSVSFHKFRIIVRVIILVFEENQALSEPV